MQIKIQTVTSTGNRLIGNLPKAMACNLQLQVAVNTSQAFLMPIMLSIQGSRVAKTVLRKIPVLNYWALTHR
jgi:hypothetical protein